MADEIPLTNTPEQAQVLTETEARIAILPEGGWMVQVQMFAKKGNRKMPIAEAGFHFINLEVGEQFIEQARKSALQAIKEQRERAKAMPGARRIILPRGTPKGESRIVKP